MKNRKILRRIVTKKMVFEFIPLRDFLIFVLPICLPLAIYNIVTIINGNVHFVFLVLSVIIISVVIALFSEYGFNENGLTKLLELIFNSKLEHIENFKKEEE